MTTLTNTFTSAQDMTVSAALDVVVAELTAVEAQIQNAGKIVPMSLSMKKAQLVSLLNALKDRKAQKFVAANNDKKKKDTDFVLVLALVARLLREKKINARKKQELAAKKAPALKIA